MDPLSALLNPSNPMFAASLGIGNQTPAAFGSLSPPNVQPGMVAPGALPAGVQGAQPGPQPQQAGQGFNPAKFNNALGMLQKTLQPQQQQQAQWMKPMNLHPQGFGMLQGF